MQVRTSKGGVELGRKGMETRARLLAAARELLQSTSPVHLTVAAIAKAAKTAPATLYVYFSDVQDVLFELAVEARDAFTRLVSDHPEWFTQDDRLEEDAGLFIAEFNRIWDENNHVLQYRTLEADRGNARFVDLQMTNAVPIMERLARAIKRSKPQLRNREAYADAVVLYCAMERLAGLRYQFPAGRPGPSSAELDKAQARIIARHLMPD